MRRAVVLHRKNLMQNIVAVSAQTEQHVKAVAIGMKIRVAVNAICDRAASFLSWTRRHVSVFAIRLDRVHHLKFGAVKVANVNALISPFARTMRDLITQAVHAPAMLPIPIAGHLL